MQKKIKKPHISKAHSLPNTQISMQGAQAEHRAKRAKTTQHKPPQHKKTKHTETQHKEWIKAWIKETYSSNNDPRELFNEVFCELTGQEMEHTSLQRFVRRERAVEHEDGCWTLWDGNKTLSEERALAWNKRADEKDSEMDAWTERLMLRIKQWLQTAFCSELKQLKQPRQFFEDIFHDLIVMSADPESYIANAYETSCDELSD